MNANSFAMCDYYAIYCGPSHIVAYDFLMLKKSLFVADGIGGNPCMACSHQDPKAPYRCSLAKYTNNITVSTMYKIPDIKHSAPNINPICK